MRKCVLPSKPNKKFQIKVKSSSLVQVLNRVDLVTKFSDVDDTLTNVHLVVACEGQVFVLGRTPDTFIAHWVPDAESSNDGAFNVDPKQLKGLVDKRDELTLDFDGSAVEIAAVKGKYSATFKTKALSSEQIPLVSEGLRHHIKRGTEMPDTLIAALRKGVSLTKVRDCYTPTTPVVCRVSFDGAELEVTSRTNWHASRFVTKIDKKTAKKSSQFRFSLSVGMFELLDRVLADQPAVFSADTTQFAAESESFVLTLPPIQSSDVDYSLVREYFEALKKPLISSVFAEGLGSALNNIKSFVGKKEKPAVTITIAPKRATIAFANDNGSLSDAIKISKTNVTDKQKVRMDYTVLGEILKYVPDANAGHSFDVYGDSLAALKMFTIVVSNDDYKLQHVGYLPQ